jgi:hypothetical protein
MLIHFKWVTELKFKRPNNIFVKIWPKLKNHPKQTLQSFLVSKNGNINKYYDNIV